MKTFVSLFLAIVIGTAPMGAATFVAAGVGASEIQTAVNEAENTAPGHGHTVIVPSGTSTYTTGVTIRRGMYLLGAGTNNTIILDNLPQASTEAGQRLFRITVPANEIFWMDGMTLSNAATRTGAEFGHGAIQVLGQSSRVRFSHLSLLGLKNRGFFFHDGIRGVVDRCYIDVQGQSMAFQLDNLYPSANGTANGNGAWEYPHTYGGLDALYVEDCVIRNKSTDSFGGSKMVFRRNYLENMWLGTHGTESTNFKRAPRSLEVYNNFFTNSYANSQRRTFVELRDGNCLVASNEVVGNYLGRIELSNYRRIQRFDPWKGADGTNVWDVNVALAESGTATGGATLQMTDSTKSWAVNQWRGYALKNKTKNKFSMVLSSTATTLSFHDGADYAADMTFTAGDEYELRWVTHALDQPGSGQCDPMLLSATVPQALNQTIEPMYQWGNTINGADTVAFATSYIAITNGVHFFNRVAHPTWVPAPYPHEMIGITQGNTPDPSITAQPQSQTITAGNTALLSVTASGTTPLAYQWHDGAAGTENPIVGATSSTYTTPALTQTKSYWVRVSNSVGTIDSATATITVTGNSPIISTHPQSQTITHGQAASLSVEASGTGTLSYQWYVGSSGNTSNPISGATSAAYAPAPASTTSYWVRVTNAFGLANSSTATVTVDPAPAGKKNPRSPVNWRRR